MKEKKSHKTAPSRTLGTCAVLGFGAQGAAIALNLRDSGCQVLVGLRPGSSSRRRAQREGLAVTSIPRAVQQAQTIIFAFPDHRHRRTFVAEIAKNLQANQTLVFLHGTSIHFGLVTPPAEVDVVMLAPHGPGIAVRESFLKGAGEMSAFWSVAQDSSSVAKRRVIALARAIGITSGKKLLETTFRDEAVGDLFGEQVVLCGGLTELIYSGFQTLRQTGISADNAYLEVCYQLDLIVNLIKRFGIEGMYQRISVAAKYGSLQTGPKLIDAGVKKRMQRALKRIESGEFARELDSLTEVQISRLNKSLKQLSSAEFEKAAKKFSK